jgi:hypothetical protein
MKIGLIALSGVRVRTEELAKLGVTLPQFVNRGRVIASLPSLGLLTVAALTPPDIEVVYRELSEVSPDDPLEPFDLVGISSFTAMIDEAYALADRYRAGGIPVVLGGLHVSLMPDEAAQHADSIVLNGAEGAWPRLVEDFRRGELQPRYIGLKTGVFEAPHYASPRFDLLQGRPYNRITVQTSRGCPHDCEFCAASLRITSRFQQKPVELAIAEIERAKAVTETAFFELADDNTFVNAKWGKKFLRALAPLEVHWFTETDISIADDEELLDLLAESGCRQVLIGLESPTAAGLDRIDRRNWKQRHFARYHEAIERIQSRGVTSDYRPDALPRHAPLSPPEGPGAPPPGPLLGPLHPVRRELPAEPHDGRGAGMRPQVAVRRGLQRVRAETPPAPLHGHRQAAPGGPAPRSATSGRAGRRTCLGKELFSGSGPARRWNSRRSRGPTCGRPSRPRHI